MYVYKMNFYVRLSTYTSLGLRKEFGVKISGGVYIDSNC